VSDDPRELSQLLDDVAADSESLVVYGPLAAEVSDRRIPDVDELPADLKVDVAVVDAREYGDAERLSALLARLRDVHAALVVVVTDDIPRNDLLALRFEAGKRTLEGARVFLSSSSVTDKRREWNNARHWANPQNFDRYRW